MKTLPLLLGAALAGETVAAINSLAKDAEAFAFTFG